MSDTGPAVPPVGKAKNLILCCDGTANEFSQDRTNVVKLFAMLDLDPERQVGYYHPGLGTMEAAGSVTHVGRWVTRLLGKAIGYGLASDIRDAYVFLMNHYEPDDRVFLFGFSRGAYTVRAVASLLKMYGLMPRGNEALVPYAIRMMSNGPSATDKDKWFTLARDFKRTFGTTRQCKPWFVGVWDTVSSIGWFENQLHLPYTADNPDIQIGRHALAIDERRAFFRTNLWRPKDKPGGSGPRDLKQVWFPGVHCDVGGGYPASESTFSDEALLWMLEEAASAGLLFSPEKKESLRRKVTAEAGKPELARMHESLDTWWWPAEFIAKRHYNWTAKAWHRRMNLGRRRTIPPAALVHKSAFSLGERYIAQLPKDAVRVE